jgi:hypothetical protein
MSHPSATALIDELQALGERTLVGTSSDTREARDELQAFIDLHRENIALATTTLFTVPPEERQTWANTVARYGEAFTIDVVTNSERVTAAVLRRWQVGAETAIALIVRLGLAALAAA